MLNCQCSRASVLPSGLAGVLPLIGQIGRGALTGGTSVLGLLARALARLGQTGLDAGFVIAELLCVSFLINL